MVQPQRYCRPVHIIIVGVSAVCVVANAMACRESNFMEGLPLFRHNDFRGHQGHY